MSVRSFDDDARLATATGVPVPRGIALQYSIPGAASASVTDVELAVADVLPGWQVRAVDSLDGWFELTPPATPAVAPAGSEALVSPTPIMPLGALWERIRQLRGLPGVVVAEPLLLVANPVPVGEVGTEAFALGPGQQHFGLWGWPYDRTLEAEIQEARRAADWHLGQLNVPRAWNVWRDRHPAGVPGENVLVGHPDTGYSDHTELTGRFQIPGRSFLLDSRGVEEIDARDDLALIGAGLLQNPGHGTATASVIASGATDAAGGAEAHGIAPGARVLPLRVSRSVIHFDFRNVGRAILHAVAEGADVISMSLGGPGYSEFVRHCIKQAHEHGVIVVAAAGNNVPATVFPAAFPEVIAVAATHAASAPWRFSGIGRLVDIAAPGEDVWCARARLDGITPSFTVEPGTGTSFATACVAGLAALWLSFHGGRAAIAQAYGGRLSLVPFAFQYVLAQTARTDLEFVHEGKHGAGIPDAEALLEAELPSLAEVERFERVIRSQPVSHLTFVSGLFTGGLGVTDRPAVTLSVEATVDDEGQILQGSVEQTDAHARAVKEYDQELELLHQLLGPNTAELADELLARITADRLLLVGFQRFRQGESLLPLIDRLLRGPVDGVSGQPSTSALSTRLAQQLQVRRQAELQRLGALHGGRLVPGVSPTQPAFPTGGGAALDGTPPPASRRLRVYAFDPSLATKLDTVPIHEVTIPTRWEHVLPGPIGEYLEVVDVDPPSQCVYSPVDLNHPYVLGQDGLPPSEHDPHSHQQMVYAVAMNTIHRFELALGRPIFWSPLRPWLRERPEEGHRFTPEALAQLNAVDGGLPASLANRDRYVQRLRVYPHALREANAYYSPQKRALLFGYFPGADDDTGRHYPGGMVFSCLSHDIIAHETTHALLDGMHPYFNEPSNEDVWAFHEAFADIMALFQHFTYPEVLRHQIAHTRGNLEADNLLAQLAQQFGQATGGRGALRNALGSVNKKTGVWERARPDPRALQRLREPHARGSILVAAVFDAFLALYNARIADLIRIYTGGSGILPEGQIHPDLVNRLASEAAATAEEVLLICIRAMDYVPPVDITMGEFLRALITADYDLSPTARRECRVAFIDAFRSWGIYPRDVSSLSEESLRWRAPSEDAPLTNLTRTGDFAGRYERTLKGLVPALEAWEPGSHRAGVFGRILEAQRAFHALLMNMQEHTPDGKPLIAGLDLRPGAGFSVGNLRPTRRTGLQGEFRMEMVVEVVQTYRPLDDATAEPVRRRGGATLVVDLRTWDVRYTIYKRLFARLPDQPGGAGRLAARFEVQRRFEEQQRAGAAGEAQAVWQGENAGHLSDWLAATYACQDRRAARRTRETRDEPFALLHRNGS